MSRAPEKKGDRQRPVSADEARVQAMYESYASMEGLPAAGSRPRLTLAEVVESTYPGLLVALTIALAAAWLAQHYGAPVMLFALLIGMAFHFLHDEGRCVAGVDFASKSVLRLGVALLGARISHEQILGLGWAPIALVIVGVASTLLVGLAMARVLGLGRDFGLLSGGSVGICGASAALAIAAVLPRSRTVERDVILVVVVVTALSTVAMVTYPVVAAGLGLSEAQAGLFLGGTIHDVAQVVGAGYTVSTAAGDAATYVKLLRVALLLPVVVVVGVAVMRGKGGGAARVVPVPWFLFGFACLVGMNSVGLLPEAVSEAAGAAARWCLLIAIAALGMKTSFKAIIQAGWRPVGVIVTETLWIALLVLAGVLLLT